MREWSPSRGHATRRSALRALLTAAFATALSSAEAARGADATTGDGSAPTVVDDVIVRGHSWGSGPTAAANGSNAYALTDRDIARLPSGATSPLTDVLARMPGVAIDQNQQIHIRNTEGPQFQYQINGVFVPFDINTNPPFLTMINPIFIKHLELLDGVLPARYSYATGGVVDIETKDGCEQPGGAIAVGVGQRERLETSGQLGGCLGRFSDFLDGLYQQGETAFSSATAGPNPIHDYTRQGQVFGYFDYQLDDRTRLSLALSAAASDNQLPNVPGLAPQYALAGVPDYTSARINSYLDFRDYLAILAVNGSTAGGLRYELAYSSHFISQAFRPDDSGELIFQGVASTATHVDIDNTLEADVSDRVGSHSIAAGLYLGEYRVGVADRSLVFPVDQNGDQSSTVPITVMAGARAINLLAGVYVDDLWRLGERLRLNAGLRFDSLTGFTNHHQIDPTFNLSYDLTDRDDGTRRGCSLHAGPQFPRHFARRACGLRGHHRGGVAGPHQSFGRGRPGVGRRRPLAPALRAHPLRRRLL